MPHPIDIAVGKNLRNRRIVAGLTQKQLGDRIGVSFQQVQKYEQGTNRMGASRLMAVCAALDLSLADLFVGIPEARLGAAAADRDANMTKEAAKVARDYLRIEDIRVRDEIKRLVHGMAKISRTGGQRG